MRFLERIADRIHARGDADARAQGLIVHRLPGGRRLIGHPNLPALLEARRRRAARDGLDLADRQMLGLAVSRSHLTSENTRSVGDGLDTGREPVTA